MIEAFPGGVIVYRDGDGSWALAPRVGDRYGFDVSGDRYAVALIDTARQRVDSVYATVAERPDIVWHAAGAPPPAHVVSGTIDGLNNDGGLVAGSHHSQRLGQTESQTFAINVPDGAQAIVFARNARRTSQNGNFRLQIDSMIVRRDVAIAGDLTQNADFAVEGQPTVITPITFDHLQEETCDVSSTFSFDDTALGLATPSLGIISPAAEQWRGGDRLAVELSCDSFAPPSKVANGFALRTVARVVTVPDLLLTESTKYELPAPLGSGGMELREGHLVFSWEPYPARGFYELTARPFECPQQEGCGLPRWSADVTEGWTATHGNSLEAISRPDLEELGLWDPALELHPDDLRWSVTAFTNVGDTISSAGWFDKLR